MSSTIANTIRIGAVAAVAAVDTRVGCLAMGDEAAEDLFVLAAETGIENVSIILSKEHVMAESVFMRSSYSLDAFLGLAAFLDDKERRQIVKEWQAAASASSADFALPLRKTQQVRGDGCGHHDLRCSATTSA